MNGDGLGGIHRSREEIRNSEIQDNLIIHARVILK
jgi:hypothetical protein